MNNAKEKLIVTMVLEEIPEGGLPLSITVSQVKELWVSRFKLFKDWKRVIYTPIPITDLQVKKVISSNPKDCM